MHSFKANRTFCPILDSVRAHSRFFNGVITLSFKLRLSVLCDVTVWEEPTLAVKMRLPLALRWQGHSVVNSIVKARRALMHPASLLACRCCARVAHLLVPAPVRGKASGGLSLEHIGQPECVLHNKSVPSPLRILSY